MPPPVLCLQQEAHKPKLYAEQKGLKKRAPVGRLACAPTRICLSTGATLIRTDLMICLKHPPLCGTSLISFFSRVDFVAAGCSVKDVQNLHPGQPPPLQQEDFWRRQKSTHRPSPIHGVGMSVPTRTLYLRFGNTCRGCVNTCQALLAVGQLARVQAGVKQTKRTHGPGMQWPADVMFLSRGADVMAPRMRDQGLANSRNHPNNPCGSDLPTGVLTGVNVQLNIP